MATDSEQQAYVATEFDVQSYQQFWEKASPDVLKRYEGRCVALQCGEQGWQIIDAAEDLEELHKSLVDSGANLDKLVFDQVHTEAATAAGIELQ